jgi:hypothetical protein
MAGFSDYRQRIIKANRQLGESGTVMHLRADVFLCQLENAYRAGAADGAAVIAELEKVGQDNGAQAGDELFRTLFGRR